MPSLHGRNRATGSHENRSQREDVDRQQRPRDLLADQPAGAPYLIPEPSSYVLGLLATAAFMAVPVRQRMKRAKH